MDCLQRHLSNPSGSNRTAHGSVRAGSLRRLRLTGAVVLAVLAGSCGDGGLVVPVAPSGPSLEGTWLGWFSSVSTGLRPATMTVFQAGPAVSGFWTTFEAGRTASGNLTGTVAGSTAFLTLRPYDAGGCSMSMVVIVTDERLEGTWSTLDCGSEDAGVFQLTPQ